MFPVSISVSLQSSMQFDENNEGALSEPPRYDSLTLRFRGDNHDVTLPYCEVANGIIEEIQEEDKNIKISLNRETSTEYVDVSFKDFIESIEKTFDTKEIVKLSVQRAETYNLISIL